MLPYDSAVSKKMHDEAREMLYQDNHAMPYQIHEPNFEVM